MKVLGTTNDGYVLSATSDEIAHLQGVYSSYNDNYIKPHVGDDININDWYRMVREALHIQAHKQPIQIVIDSLNGAIKMLDFVSKQEKEDDDKDKEE